LGAEGKTKITAKTHVFLDFVVVIAKDSSLKIKHKMVVGTK